MSKENPSLFRALFSFLIFIFTFNSLAAAPVPVVYWDRDFSTATKTGVPPFGSIETFHLSLNGNALNNGIVTIGSSPISIYVNQYYFYEQNVTVLIKYANFTPNGYQALISLNSYTTGNDRFGLYSTPEGGTAIGIGGVVYSTAAGFCDNTHKLSGTGDAFRRCALALSENSLSASVDGVDVNWNRASELFGGLPDFVYALEIGGLHINTGVDNRARAATGMKVKAIAVFCGTYSAAQLAEYEFPSDPEAGDEPDAPTEFIYTAQQTATAAERATMTAAGWTGTVVFTNYNVNGQSLELPFANYGNASSTLKLANVTGYLSKNATFPGLTVLVNDGVHPALTINNGFSNDAFDFARISGDGGIIDVPTSNAKYPSQLVRFNNAEGFTGSLTTHGKRLVFGTSSPATAATITVDSGKVADLAAHTVWSADNGIFINGKIRLQGEPQWSGRPEFSASSEIELASVPNYGLTRIIRGNFPAFANPVTSDIAFSVNGVELPHAQLVIRNDGIYVDYENINVENTHLPVTGSPTAITMSFITELPSGSSGVLMGFHVVRSATASWPVQAVYQGDGRFALTYDNATAAGSQMKTVVDPEKPHIYTLVHSVGGGTYLYIDGEMLVSAGAIKWSSSTIADEVWFRSRYGGGDEYVGIPVVNPQLVCGTANVDAVDPLSGYTFPADVSSYSLSDLAWLIMNRADANKNVSAPQIAVNGRTLAFAEAVEACKAFGRIDDFEVQIAIDNFSMENGLALRISPSVAGGTLSVLAAQTLDGVWSRIECRRRVEAGEYALDVSADEWSNFHFFRLRAESGERQPGLTAELAFGAPSTDGGLLASALELNGPLELGAITLSGLSDEDYAATPCRELHVRMSANCDLNGATVYLADGARRYAGTVVGDTAVFTDLPMIPAQTRLSLLMSPVPGLITVKVEDWNWRGERAQTLNVEPVAVADYLAHLPSSDFALPYFSSGNEQYRIPAIAKGDNGLVLALYDMRYNGGDLGAGGWPYSAIDIAGNISTDHGNSWGAPFIAIDVENNWDTATKTARVTSGRPDGRYDLGDICVLYDATNRQFWAMGITGGGLSAKNSADYPRSFDVVMYTRGPEADDEWRPWTGGPAGNERSIKDITLRSLVALDPSINTNFTAGLQGILQGPGHGIQCRDGTLVFPMQYFGSSGTRDFALYSEDYGVTWQATKLCTNEFNTQEGCVMELDDGSWLQMAKSNYSNRRLFRCRDRVNWQHIGNYSPSTYVQGSGIRIGRHTDGTSRYALCFCDDGGSRNHLALHIYRDTTAADPNGNGVEFTGEIVTVVNGATGGRGYNSLVMLENNILGVLWESDRHIYFRRIDISALLQ